MKATDFFDLKGSLASHLLMLAKYPWDALDMLGEYIRRIGRALPKSEFCEVKREIWVSRKARISDNVIMKAPLIVAEGCEIGSSALLGESLIEGGCVIGSHCEVKSSVMFWGVRAPQHNYISDSLVGRGVLLGAGAIISSIHSSRGAIICTLGEKSHRCEHRRLGAVIGDGAEIGCSSILLAGTVVERGAKVGPLMRARGFVCASKTYKGERILSDIM